MRVIGFTAVVLCGLFFGLDRYTALKCRVNILCELEKLLYFIDVKMKYSSDDIKSILKGSDNQIAVKITAFTDKEGDILLSWKKAGKCLFKNAGDLNLFECFIEDFGNMDLESQCRTTEKYIKETELIRADAEKELTEKGKIKVIFPLFISLTAAIMLL